MIQVYLGKTGGGKSYRAVKEVVDELRFTDHYICTNLPINKALLNEYLQKEYPKEDFDCTNRIRLLTDEEAHEFYLHRENGNDIPPVSKQDEDARRFPNFDAHFQKPILYVIDEAHIYFDARCWDKVGRTLTFYASQHRKMHDRVIFVTQFLDQLEKRLRLQAVEFHECQNLGIKRFMTFWRLPKMFWVNITYKAPPCPSEAQETYRINPKLANCYNTTGGVGISGKRGAEKERTKGMPFWTIGIGIAALGILLMKLPDWVANGFMNIGTPNVKKVDKPVAPTVTPALPLQPSPQFTPPQQKPVIDIPGSNTPVQPRFKPQTDLFATGYAVKGGKVNVQLSDGSIITEAENMNGIRRITMVSRAFVVYDGKPLYFLPRPKDVAPKAVETKSAASAKPDKDEKEVLYEEEPEPPTWRRDKYGINHLLKKETLTKPPVGGP